MIETSSVLPLKSSAIFGNLLQLIFGIYRKMFGTIIKPSDNFWSIFGNLWKVFENLWKVVKTKAVISMFI